MWLRVLGALRRPFFKKCFPDSMTWNEFYVRGMNVCRYVDVFWHACHDVGLEFGPVGVIGFDETGAVRLF